QVERRLRHGDVLLPRQAQQRRLEGDRLYRLDWTDPVPESLAATVRRGRGVIGQGKSNGDPHPARQLASDQESATPACMQNSLPQHVGIQPFVPEWLSQAFLLSAPFGNLFGDPP